MSLRALSFALALLLARPVAGQLPVIELRSLVPMVVQSGATIPMRADAASGEEIDRLVFSQAGIQATLVTSDPRPLTDQRVAQHGQFQVAFPAELPMGLVEARAVGRFGISNPRPLLVTPLPVQEAPADRGTLEAPVELPPNVWWHTQAGGAQKSYLKLIAPAGQLCSLSIFAPPNHTRAIPAVVIRDAAGREILRSRVLGGAPWSWSQTPDSDTQYIVELRDFLYRGGEEMRYCILHGQGQLPWQSLEPLPESLAAFSPSSLGYARWFDPAIPVTTLAETPESKPLSVAVPALVEGAIEADFDRDAIEFPVAANRPVVIEVLSDRMAQWTDLRLVLDKVDRSPEGVEKLERIAVIDDLGAVGAPAMSLGTRDPAHLLNLPADSTVRATWMDLQTGRRVPRSAYRCLIREAKPDLEAIAYWPFPTNNAATGRPAGVHLLRGGNQSLRVVVRRLDGWNGPVRLKIDPLPPGIQSPEIVLSPEQNEGELVLSAAEDAPAFLGPVQVVASARIGEADVVKQSAYGTLAQPATGDRGAIQSRQCDSLWLAVSDRDLHPLQVRAGADPVPEIVQGAKWAIPIQVARRPGGDQNCVLRPQNLPPKAGLGELTIEAAKADAAPEIQIAADTPPGDYTFWFQVESKVKMKTNPQALERERAARMHWQAIVDDPNRAGDHEAAKKELAACDQRIEQLKPHESDREFTVFFPSTPVRIKVIAPPPAS
ncbi:MAG: hypothetical protein ACKN9U_21795 [Pirellulaceae bacterium]